MNRKAILNLAWIIGGALIIFLILKIGPGRIWSNIKTVSIVNFLLLFFFRFIYWLLRTLYWKMILNRFEPGLSFFNLFQARIVGHAISYLTPSAHLGGEVIRTYMVNCPNRRKCLASVILDKTIEILTVIVFAVIGLTIALIRISIPTNMKIFLIGSVAMVILFVAFLIHKQRKGLLTWLSDLIGKVRIRLKFLQKSREKIEEADLYISEFLTKHKIYLFYSILFYAFIILFWTGEIHLTLLVMGVHVRLIDSFLIVTLGTIAFFLPFFPASVGTYEAAYVAVFGILGMQAGAGLALTVIRRILALFWAGAGLVMIYIKRRRI
ncbi:MAG: flippase-like domain-containing protein [Candidatus Aminicenantes bacterium]|nr:flippase-like domain-containing protein [Candidatus Aminicenantes bacterium]